MSTDIGMEVIDGRDALGIVIFREMENGQIESEIKGLAVDKLTAAKLFMQLGRALKAQYDAETTNQASGSVT